MNVKKLESKILGILNKYQAKPDRLIFAKDIGEFLESEGVPSEDDIGRLGMTRHNPQGAFVMIFKEKILMSDAQSVLGLIIYRFGNEKYKKLCKIKFFIVHLILHETAHAIGIKDEYKADEWAFQKLDEEYALFWPEEKYVPT